MSLSVENANLVRQKVKIALANAHPMTQAAFEAFQKYMATQKGNPDLQFIPFVGTSIDDAGGQVLADAACTVYGVWGKKAATATDVYLVLLDDATDDSGGATDARLSVAFLESGEEGLLLFPKGLTMAAGVVAKAYTDYDGTTDSSAGDCPDGFIIVGASGSN